ncbi:MAG: hypothetical protein EPO35_06055 [Acidobacteria bacterium]|nr:MAG: hypothetical protein EPO35_06055 [Acidobacteriota bacterium]
MRLLLTAFVLAVSTLTAAPALPERLTDAEFWALSSELSEPAGSFRSENLVSNETMYQWPIPDLKRTVTPGAVYMGVAPDQNFTYITAVKPRMAFIVDIRRGNLLEHLLYKALFEMSATRAEFLSKLFSMPKLRAVSENSSPRELFDAAYMETADQTLFEANTKAVLDVLTVKHGFKLSLDDESQLTWIYSCFFKYGPDLTYQACESGGGAGFGGGRGFGRGYGGMAFRSFADLQLQTDAAGANHAYLATETNYRWMKEFEARNLVVPVMGDFMGPKAIRAVGAWVRDHGAVVGTFYTSNVEQYLFQSTTWNAFYANIATLPLDNGSTLIRSVPNNMVQPAQPGARAASMLTSMKELTAAFTAGKVLGYYDVVKLSRQ